MARQALHNQTIWKRHRLIIEIPSAPLLFKLPHSGEQVQPKARAASDTIVERVFAGADSSVGGPGVPGRTPGLFSILQEQFTLDWPRGQGYDSTQ
ncbi:MAG: hypothetical protein A3H28_02410 [Acidobacteria bacterium RIFCSPLOWO2_02_FULL_61_28]|nr:MAG: hypothetical protein A3H28_02410 [Acidobacteria bacterium RIFCSPLOWO2_02_FULL_61_28]